MSYAIDMLARAGGMKQDSWFSGDSEVNLDVSWAKFEDVESEIARYAWLIGTSPCGNQLKAEQVNDLKLSFKHIADGYVPQLVT